MALNARQKRFNLPDEERPFAKAPSSDVESMRIRKRVGLLTPK
jgi:hypothetical protein